MESKTIQRVGRLLHIQRSYADVECNNCHVTSRVELSEDGEPDFETTRCADDSCVVRVCKQCEHVCASCDQVFCADHAPMDISGGRYCLVCAAGEVVDGGVLAEAANG